jgi:hypothetical protein
MIIFLLFYYLSLRYYLYVVLKISIFFLLWFYRFEVSKVVWKMLLTNHRELRHVKAYRNEPFASRRSSGRYMPYSNVDSFLKVSLASPQGKKKVLSID